MGQSRKVRGPGLGQLIRVNPPHDAPAQVNKVDTPQPDKPPPQVMIVLEPPTMMQKLEQVDRVVPPHKNPPPQVE